MTDLFCPNVLNALRMVQIQPGKPSANTGSLAESIQMYSPVVQIQQALLGSAGFVSAIVVLLCRLANGESQGRSWLLCHCC